MTIHTLAAPRRPVQSIDAIGDGTFDPQTLADDLCEVHRIYANFFAGLSSADWFRAALGGPHEWTFHETVAHLCALTGAGLESIQAALRGENYHFHGLDDRYQFTAFNRRGIDEHLPMPTDRLCAEFLYILDQTIAIARREPIERLEIASEMPIYNRPVKIYEAMGIMMFHAGLHHSAQVAEPVGQTPLWQQLSPEIRRRVIGRVLRALSLLYRYDLAPDLRAIFAFRVDGPGGGAWHLDVSPLSTSSAAGPVDQASLTLHLRETAVFCQMFTGRLNLPWALLTGRLKLRGDPRLFFRMGSLFSVEARA